MEQTATNENFSAALDLLEEAAAQKRDELKTIMTDKYSNLRNLILEGQTTFMKTWASTRDQAIRTASRVKDVSVEKARTMAHDVDKDVRQNPWAYVAGSAVIGLFIGFILGRSR